MTNAERFARLYNASKPQGMGFLHYDPAMMTIEEAEAVLAESSYPYVDYHKGRVIKVDFSTDAPNYRMFDRDNGEGAALRALSNPETLAPRDRTR